MDEEASIILGDAIAFCQRDGQDARLINMLGQSRAISLTEDTLTIEAPSRFAIAQLKKHQPTIEAYLEEIAFAPIALDIVAPQGAATESAAATAPVANRGGDVNERTRHAHAHRSRRSGGRGFGHCNQEHALGRRFSSHDEPDEGRSAD